MPSRRQATGISIAFVFLCTLFLLVNNTYTILPPQQSPNMPITHIVMFQFKSGVSAEVVKDTCTRMLALKDNCLHPQSQKPYITSSSGGADNSNEGIQNGITHAFVVEFANAEDRDYYVQKDPAHQGFVKSLDGLIEKAQVIDFTDRVY